MKLHWVLLSLIACASFSVMVTLITFLIKKGYPLAFILSGIFLVGFIAYGLQTYQTTQLKLSIPLPIILIIIAMGILSFIGNWAQFQATHTAPNAGLAIAIVSLQAGIIAVLSVFFFKDKMTSMQLLGLVVALLGVVLISLGGSNATASKDSQLSGPNRNLLEK